MDSAASPEPANSADAAIAPKEKWSWKSLLTTLPIVLTILATAFAGMSSSEMTQAMYYRSLAAQHQSKAGDQWAFFQAKRIRGTTLETTAELLQSLARPAPFDLERVDQLSSQLLAAVEKAEARDSKNAPTGQAAVDRLRKTRAKVAAALGDESIKKNLPILTNAALPKSESLPLENKQTADAVEAAVKAVRQRKTEAETAELVRKLSPDELDQAVRLAEQNADNFDQACEPVNETIKQCRAIMAELSDALRPLQQSGSEPAGADRPFGALVTALNNQETGFKLAVQEFDARRYRHESLLNRKAAEMYELRVRRSGIESDRHRERSKMFFYSMLVAQVGVTIASLALARTERKSLWLLAALAGLVAVVFSSYVYVSL